MKISLHNLKDTRENKSQKLSRLLAALAIALLCSMSQLLLTGSILDQNNNRQNTPTEIIGLIDNLKKRINLIETKPLTLWSN